MALPHQSTPFHCQAQSCTADVIPPEEVRARIEVLAKHFLESLNSPNPSISILSLVCRTTESTQFQEGFSTGSFTYLSRAAQQKKSFTQLNGMRSFVKVWKLMQIVYELLQLGKKATQRELYYRLLADSPDYFRSQQQVNDTIQDLVALLKCSRYSLGIIASSKGAVVGRLLIEDESGEVVDCTRLGPSGHIITADLGFLEGLRFRSDARYILVVEKDAIFQRLSEDRYFQSFPAIILTAKGYPDLASRVMLYRICKAFPGMPILALVDWNPAGLAIICTYKFGSTRMGLEAPRYVCDVKWLGLRGEDIELLPKEALIEFSHKDHQLARSLLASKMLENREAYKLEVGKMMEMSKRAEIEALYAHGYDFLGHYITQKILRLQYI
ncbi:hypothetical protein O6H91_06G084500 [Diphasiastrum complanatum]|uniref:Uncharacterized protein n=1 Tax=Diphasiastrum complanatum TaxID=34168 RepID=A0ACC2DGI9_DIPCM|nr:hypothetical protein O6H91_06G084500 [Diphasiastrum complanatum]